MEKAQSEVEEATQAHSDTKAKNVMLEHEIETLITKVTRIKDEKVTLEDKVLDEKTKYDKVAKNNLLVDELNKEMLEMNIEDLCKFVNQSLYDCVHGIRRSNIKEIIKTGDKVLDMMKEQKLDDAASKIETIMNQFEFLRDDSKTKTDDDDKKCTAFLL